MVNQIESPKRIIFVKGTKGTGKTTFATSFIDYCVETDSKMLYLDTERSLEEHIPKMTDKKWERLDNFSVNGLEQLCEKFSTNPKGQYSTVVIDSVNPLHTWSRDFIRKYLHGVDASKFGSDEYFKAIANAMKFDEQDHKIAMEFQRQFYNYLASNTNFGLIILTGAYVQKPNSHRPSYWEDIEIFAGDVIRTDKRVQTADEQTLSYFAVIENLRVGKSGINIDKPCYESVKKYLFPQNV